MREFENHIEVIAEVVRHFPKIGKTGIMKCMYFLQEVFNVDLGHRFSMYTYGPFAPDVLGEISAATNDGYIKSEMVNYPNGIGYKFRSLEKPVSTDVINECSKHIEFLKKNFNDYDAKSWELAATIVYVSKLNKNGVDALVEWVNKLKPHFDKEKIRTEYERIAQLGMTDCQEVA